MTITLTIVNVPALPQGLPLSFTVAGRSFRIGREGQADWILPDPTRHISTLHAEVAHEDGVYWLNDRSTNGVFLNGSREKLGAAHRLADGDRILIGSYIISVATVAEAARQISSTPAGGSFVEAFARASGIPISALADRNEQELASEIGTFVRQTTESAMAMLRARAQMRSTMKSAAHTLVGTTGNNPLKLMPEPAEAMQAMFGPGRAGYLRASAALPEALSEIELHQAATWSAMQAALAGLLDELAPDGFEDRAGASAFGSRKARAWDLFVQRWMELEAGENGMLDAWLERFAPAYDAATKKG